MPIIDNVPPQDIEAEKAALCSIFIQKDVINSISDILEPDDFYRVSNRDIYSVMLDLSMNNNPIDLITVTSEMDRLNILEKDGGIAYVSGIANTVPTAANAEYYAKLIHDKARLRRLINTAHDIAGTAYGQAGDVDNIIDDAEKSILELSLKRGSRDFAKINEVTARALDKMNRLYEANDGMLGIPTGYKDLDRVLCGLNDTDFIIIAARPSMGKTAFALNLMANAALRKHYKVAFFSMEMSDEQLVRRLISSESGVSSETIKAGFSDNVVLNSEDESEWEKVIDATERINEAPIYISERSATSVMDIRSMSRRLKREIGLDLIIIDYIQLMGSDIRIKGGHEQETRQMEVSAISRSLKLLAKELEIPIIAISQLSRNVESRVVKIPMLSDLRESGSLEQDADVVMFLYREDYYIADSDKQGQTEIIIGKNRNGPTGSVTLMYKSDCTKFIDMQNYK